jgi:hypothetical protein
MSNYFYPNQFKKKRIVGESYLNVAPNPFQMDVKYDPEDTSTNRLIPAEGVILKDLGANDVAVSGIPIVGKRTANTDAVYGVKLFSVLKNQSIPGDNVVIATKGDVVAFQCSGAVARGEKVSLVLASTGYVKVLTTGYAEIGVALDKGANDDVIRVELTCDNTAVSAT